MLNTNNLKKGVIIKLDDKIYELLEYQHYKPGKGPAFVRVKVRDTKTGSIVEKKLRSGEKVEDIYVEKKNCFFSYKQDNLYIFLEEDTYEQISVEDTILGEKALFIKEDLPAIIQYYQGELVSVELPSHVVLEVTYAEPAVKGDTVTSATKPVTLETGLVIQCPLFVKIGDKIKVDTRDKTYVERA